MKKPAFMKQKNMLRVLYALIPAAIAAVYYFGWRVLAIVAVSGLFAFLTEWIMVAKKTNKVTYAAFVTAALYGLSLPPTIPFWIAAVGVVFAILFGKMVFGGFGKNVFNPAIVGRAFVYVCFPVDMTSRFVPVFRDFPGGLVRWVAKDVDAMTAATPMWSRRDYGVVTETWDLITGRIGMAFEYQGKSQMLAAGSAGEVCAIAIIIGAAYLLWTKTANYRLMLSTLIGAVGLNVVLRHIMGFEGVPPVPFTLFSGAFLYAMVFMVTDPVSAPKDKLSIWIYGIFIGAMIVFFRYKAVFAGGVAFAVLLGNMLGPSLDLWIKRYRARKKEASA